MLRGDRIGLRARTLADVPILQAELHDDVLTTARSSARPWVPVTPGTVDEPYGIAEPDPAKAVFSVITLPGAADEVGGELAGHGALWGIDLHNRCAGLGLNLRPGARGKGYATDVVRVLCHYGFDIRGLHRIEIETLADNAPMRAVAVRAGFVEEGVRRRVAWIDGDFHDCISYGLLATERPARR